MAGDEAFAAIPDLLDFEPVPRRAHANGWTPEHQRAFIAALAITGSPRQAARHVGRAQYGAEQLRTAKGGRSFAASWDAAMELARDCELGRLHENLGELARKTEEAHAAAKEAGRLVPPDAHDDGEGDGSYERHIEEVRERVFDKLQKLRRRELIEEVIPFPEKREAWITLYGSVEIQEIEGGSTEGKATGSEADTSTSPRDEHRSHAGVHGEKRNGPDRPTGREANPIDVTESLDDRQDNSLRDGAGPSDSRSSRAKSRGTPPEKPAPSSSKRSGPRVRRM